MKNLTKIGESNIATYLKHYNEGKLSFFEVKRYLNYCFYDVFTGPIGAPLQKGFLINS